MKHIVAITKVPMLAQGESYGDKLAFSLQFLTGFMLPLLRSVNENGSPEITKTIRT